LTEVEYFRRVAWIPAAIAPAVVLYTEGRDPGFSLIQFAYLTLFCGGFYYPPFVLLSLRRLRGRPARSHWRYGSIAPLLFGLICSALNGFLLILLSDAVEDALVGAGVFGAVIALVGYGCVAVAYASSLALRSTFRAPPALQ